MMDEGSVEAQALQEFVPVELKEREEMKTLKEVSRLIEEEGNRVHHRYDLKWTEYQRNDPVAKLKLLFDFFKWEGEFHKETVEKLLIQLSLLKAASKQSSEVQCSHNLITKSYHVHTDVQLATRLYDQRDQARLRNTQLIVEIDSLKQEKSIMNDKINVLIVQLERVTTEKSRLQSQLKIKQINWKEHYKMCSQKQKQFLTEIAAKEKRFKELYQQMEAKYKAEMTELRGKSLCGFLKRPSQDCLECNQLKVSIPQLQEGRRRMKAILEQVFTLEGLSEDQGQFAGQRLWLDFIEERLLCEKNRGQFVKRRWANAVDRQRSLNQWAKRSLHAYMAK